MSIIFFDISGNALMGTGCHRIFWQGSFPLLTIGESARKTRKKFFLSIKFFFWRGKTLVFVLKNSRWCLLKHQRIVWPPAGPFFFSLFDIAKVPRVPLPALQPNLTFALLLAGLSLDPCWVCSKRTTRLASCSTSLSWSAAVVLLILFRRIPCAVALFFFSCLVNFLAKRANSLFFSTDNSGAVQ